MTGRTAAEIVSLILQSAEKGATKPTLMYETYLPHDSLKEYLAQLLEKGFIEYLGGEMKYRTTPKGLIFLSDTRARREGFNHQCKKCGVLYYCKQTNCQNPFHHAVCHRCSQFFNIHNRCITGEAHDVPELRTKYVD